MANLPDWKVPQQTINRKQDEEKRFYNSLSRYMPLPADEQVKLAILARNGDEEARHRLLLSNIRLVMSVAADMHASSMSISDLVMEGYIGMNKAIDKFDDQAGTRFISYAIMWIRNQMIEALREQSGGIVVPANRAWQARQLQKEEDRRYTLQLPALTPDEIKQWVKDSGYGVKSESYEGIMTAYNAMSGSLKLDEPIKDDECTTFVDMMADMSAKPADASMDNRDLHNILMEAMRVIKGKKCRHALMLYFGFCDGREHTIDEIAIIINSPRSSVQVMIRKAMNKLSDPKTKRFILESFYGK